VTMPRQPIGTQRPRESMPELICFDVGYTLIDETRSWREWAKQLQLAPHKLFAALKQSIELREPQPNRAALEKLRPGLDLETERAAIVGRVGASIFLVDDLYPDARPALQALRAAGFKLAAAGNMRTDTEGVLLSSGLPLDFVGSSERWGVSKPDLKFFDKIVDVAGIPWNRIVYVGDRVDNDVIPARNAGMWTVLVRRGLWAESQTQSAEADAAIHALTELPELLGAWRSRI
jgi:FMN phosphatase YigB (HAD superfamily)